MKITLKTTFFLIFLSDFNSRSSTSNNMTNNTNPINCIDSHINGTIVHLNCSKIVKSTERECESILTPLHIYGANMIVFANTIYILPYAIVCVVYLLIPGIRHRAYDLAVFNYAGTQIVLSLVIIGLGYSMLCHVTLNKVYYSLIGLTLEALTISSVLWLLIISFEVASTITQFRWAPNSGTKDRGEYYKFLIYLIWITIGTFIPTIVSTVLEFSPLPDDHIAKPSFHNISHLNISNIVHVAIVPVLTAIASSILFIYTTVKMINIQKSTSAANENRKKTVKEKYILYLKLYLLMDAPYITGALGSIYEDLWILKFCRMLQPMLMLYAVLPRETVAKYSLCIKRRINNKKESKQNANKPKPVNNAV